MITESYIRMTAPITPMSTERLLQVVDTKYRSGVNRLHLLLSTPGGSVSHGIYLYNLLRGLPIEVVTYNIGTVDSIGVIVYCAGKERISVPHARFFLHPIGMDVGNLRVDEHWIKETQSSLRIDQANIAKIIASTTDKDADAVETDISERKSLLPDEAIQYGLVQELKTDLLPSEADLTPIYESEAFPHQQPLIPGPSQAERPPEVPLSLPDSNISTYQTNVYRLAY